ncbi:TrmB family transcriptional regulator [Rhizobium leguminosarum]|uniref:TrmB family transcriptional regulator n=1 Tax=Rhizobium leguminosarum TaxID=384 RepID=UPI001C987F60|nr:helix-turn-helix domain-containing protein [Rhizobium leguminosarum]MBY5774878.1 TrmB family transcriptional regulator [Rhizobium leguminosarum]
MAQSSTSEIVDRLVQIGFSDQEARIYMTLVLIGPATAYELGKQARLAVPNTYNVMRSLTGKGAAHQVSGQPARYIAVPPQQFFDAMASKTTRLCQELAGKLNNLRQDANDEYVEMLSAPASLEKRILATIDDAVSQIVLKTTSPVPVRIHKALQAAAKRGVEILFVYYGEKPRLPSGAKIRLWPHEGNAADVGPDFFILCVDSRRALVRDPSGMNGAYSENLSFVHLAGVYLRHEIYLAEIMMRFEDEIESEFGPALYKLRGAYGMLPLQGAILSFAEMRQKRKR